MTQYANRQTSSNSELLGQRDSSLSKALALHEIDQGSIPGTAYGLSPRQHQEGSLS